KQSTRLIKSRSASSLKGRPSPERSHRRRRRGTRGAAASRSPLPSPSHPYLHRRPRARGSLKCRRSETSRRRRGTRRAAGAEERDELGFHTPPPPSRRQPSMPRSRRSRCFPTERAPRRNTAVFLHGGRSPRSPPSPLPPPRARGVIEDGCRREVAGAHVR
uniref:Uncharacterized protein n=1 Tax=Triticum urartu TaxID=4572 RepID=A0A8R7PV59_TRIUA